MKFLNDNIDFSKVSINFADKRGFFIGGISYSKKDFEELGFYGSVDIVFDEVSDINLVFKIVDWKYDEFVCEFWSLSVYDGDDAFPVKDKIKEIASKGFVGEKGLRDMMGKVAKVMGR
ncbi:MAG: hypothetical protein RSC93_01820 [Erysipelotrichaceae bacterium]